MPPADLIAMLCSLAADHGPSLLARSMRAAMKSILLHHVVGFVRDHPLLIGGNGEGGDSARGCADVLVVPRVGGSIDPTPSHAIVCIPLHGFAAGFPQFRPSAPRLFFSANDHCAPSHPDRKHLQHQNMRQSNYESDCLVWARRAQPYPSIWYPPST
jgi:hypothetical protein